MIYTIGNAKDEIRFDNGSQLTESLGYGADHCTNNQSDSAGAGCLDLL
jgi:hypothetical protein